MLNLTGDLTSAHLMAEIGRLQKELDFANESIDDKLDKLEEAGLGVIGLSKALEDARLRITSLEEQLARLEEREVHHLSSHRCKDCDENLHKSATKRYPQLV